MKLKILPIFIFGVCAINTAHAYEVPTSQQKKKILLEEFTGIKCGYCPQGHTIARNMQAAQPENTYVIAIHSGDFAMPSSDQPDFRTEVGDIINKTIGAEFYKSGYPSGFVNRHVFAGTSPIASRGDWTKYGKKINQETAPVNLLMKSQFDGTTRKLDVTVEGYYTEDVAQTFNLLNVAIVQSNIIGPQNGGAMGSEYVHNHMLRNYITPTWGDTIKTPKKGEYFSRNYTYILPADLKGVELKVEDIELIAFICADKTEVLNVTGEKPSYENYNKELNATLLSPDREIKVNYGFNFFEAKLKNTSDQKITSAEFLVTINGANQTVNWEGEVNSFETKPIVIKVSPYNFVQQNAYTITLSKLNGQNVTGNQIKGSFNSPAICTPQVNFEFQTDLYADENGFVIKDQDGNVIKEFGPYVTDKKAIYKESASLELGKIYCFEINDTWGDGIQEPRGYYKITNTEDNSMIAQQYDVKLFGDRFFFNTSLTSDISSSKDHSGTKVLANPGSLDVLFTPAGSGDIVIELYSAKGEKITSEKVYADAKASVEQNISTESLPKGMYFIKICENDHISIVKTMIR